MATFKKNEWFGKRVLITGASGFVGKHLVRMLDSEGAQLGLILRQPLAEFEGMKLFLGDLTHHGFIEETVASWQPEIVYHLAASRARSLSKDAFIETIEVNLFGSLNLLMSMKYNPNVKRIIMLGTAEEYGRGVVPFIESAREAPVSAYSLSKASVTHLAQMSAHIFDLPTTVLRPSIAYGPEQKEDMFLPSLIRTLLRGDKFAMTAGDQTRDFIYIDDLIEALCVSGIQIGISGEIINIGSGRAIRIADLVNYIVILTEGEGLVQQGAIDYRRGEIFNYQIDIEKAFRLLGWKPKHDLYEGLVKTIAWYKSNKS